MNHIDPSSLRNYAEVCAALEKPGKILATIPSKSVIVLEAE